MKAIHYHPSPPHSLYKAEFPKPVPQAGELLVKVKANALNRADLAQKRGNYPPPPGASEILGLEASGVVVDAAPDCQRFSKGDEAMMLLAGGGYGEYVACPEVCAMPKPNSLSWEEAACVSEVFITTYQALFDLGQVREGESVLLHGGASGIGTAGVQLAQKVGAKVFTTAGSAEKCRFLEDQMGVARAINYKSEDFASILKEETSGKGVDFILDIAGGSHYEKNIRSIGVDGRWVVLAFLGGRYTEKFDFAKLLLKRVKLMGSTLRARDNAYKGRLIQEFEQRFLPLIESREILPVIDQVFPWQEAWQAHEYMEGNKNIGKIVLRRS